MNERRLWLGREGAFRLECEALLALLRGPPGWALKLRHGPAEGFDWVADASALPKAQAPAGQITLYTSGSTGEPKAVTRSWLSAMAARRGNGSPSERWLLTYSPARWAGLSVLGHCLKHGCQVVVPESLEVKAIASALREATHVSLTPSLFRKLLASGWELHNPKLVQLTFGGEMAGQRLLDDARQTWPKARVSHIYASTELGDLACASDGLEGYRRLPGPLEPDGELVVDGFRTGDLFRKTEDRFLFVGRKSEIISVGAAKVNPSEVQEVMLLCPEVREAKVYPVPSPLLGQLVGADYSGNIEPQALSAFLRERLPKYALPRLKKVESIALSSAGKVVRT